MHTIEIDDELYLRLRVQQRDFSESASDVLRRMLRLDKADRPAGRPENENSQISDEQLKELAEHVRTEHSKDPRKRAVCDFLNSPEFRAERTAVARFVSILGFVHRENRSTFSAVEKINGRTRKYFGRTESDLEQSGNSVHPKEIPGSHFWVVTNNSTQTKVELLIEVLTLLTYEMGFALYVAGHITS
jgi:negative modulator of initiation of replication